MVGGVEELPDSGGSEGVLRSTGCGCRKREGKVEPQQDLAVLGELGRWREARRGCGFLGFRFYSEHLCGTASPGQAGTWDT